jgi:thiol:disulfide interchange protein DsbC
MRMPSSWSLAVLAALSLTVATTAPAQAQQQPPAKAATKPASSATSAAPTRPAPVATTVSPEVRARIAAKMPGAKITDIAISPIPGVYEVTMGGLIAYVSADGRYLMSGSLYDLDTQANLTDERRATARAKVLAALPENQMIVFSPANPKMTVTVFTDIDCGFCRRFHNQIAEINKAGVKVRYMLYPRTGPGSESWRKAEQVWCAADRKDALTRSKRGEPVKSKDCKSAQVANDFRFGEELGVEGTPAVFTEGGVYIGGFMTPDQLVQAIREAGA